MVFRRIIPLTFLFSHNFVCFTSLSQFYRDVSLASIYSIESRLLSECLMYRQSVLEALVLFYSYFIAVSYADSD